MVEAAGNRTRMSSGSPNAVITGASTGIGHALALELARRGYSLGVTARRMPLLEQLRDRIHETCGRGLQVELATLDVCRTADVGATMRDLFARLGRVDTVVVNAGANDITNVGCGELDKQLNLIATNLAGAIATVDAAAEYFLEAGRGHIVGISSLASRQPLPQQAAYCASKAGFSMYLNAVRIDLRKLGIAVTDILPGYIKTDIVEGVDIGTLPFAVSPEKAAHQIASLIEKRVKVGIVPAFPWRLLRPFLGHLPESLAKY